jgi:hypothetical protein
MENDELRDWYLALADHGKQVFLALLSHNLTIQGRAVGLNCLSEGEQNKAFKGLNELQHQISGHIAAIGVGRDRYSDDVLWDICLIREAAAHGLSGELRHWLEFTRSRNVWDKAT